MISTPYKIVGAGLAGINLAWHFYFSKTPFEIIDGGDRSTAKAAAGLVNPVVFKRLNKSWMADEIVPYLKKFYRNAEEVLGKEHFIPLPLKRVIIDIENSNDWGARRNDEGFQKYFGLINENTDPNIQAPFGLGEVCHTGYLKLQNFIEDSLAYFKRNGVVIKEEKFDYSEINGPVVFCEGAGIRNNPYFNYLPLKEAQGETLIIKTTSLNIDFVLSKKMFVLPLGNGVYKIGATYNWNLKEPIITAEAKKELLEKLMSFTDFEFEVVDHLAGIRPAMSDRRPVLGTHPEHHNLHVFNGLGTKGVMLSPYFANEMCSYLLNKKPLNKDVNIRRFDRLMNE